MNQVIHSSAGVLALAIRLCLAAVFLYSGATKLIGFEGAVAEMAGLGLPLPPLTAAATILVQLAAGLAIATGFFIAPAALALAAFTFVATLIGHPFWTFGGVEFTRQLTTALEHLAIIGGLLLLAQSSIEQRAKLES